MKKAVILVPINNFFPFLISFFSPRLPLLAFLYAYLFTPSCCMFTHIDDKFDARKIPAIEWLACKLEDIVHSMGLCLNCSCCSYPSDVHQPYTNTNTTYRATGVRHPLLVQGHLRCKSTPSSSTSHLMLRVIDRSDSKETMSIPAEAEPVASHSEWV